MKLSDFGIAKAVRQRHGNVKQRRGAGQRTVRLPEQARSGFVDATSDIYSLGIVLYEMTVGKLPLRGIPRNHRAEAYSGVRDSAPGAVPGCAAHAGMCDPESQLKRTGERRYQSAADMAADLRHVLADPNGDWLAVAGEELSTTRAMQQVEAG